MFRRKRSPEPTLAVLLGPASSVLGEAADLIVPDGFDVDVKVTVGVEGFALESTVRLVRSGCTCSGPE